MPPSAANPSPTAPTATPGSTYKLVVRSADEAVRTIREQLGDQARVLSVRQLPLRGFTDLFTRPRLEVIAEVGGARPALAVATTNGTAPANATSSTTAVTTAAASAGVTSFAPAANGNALPSPANGRLYHQGQPAAAYAATGEAAAQPANAFGVQASAESESAAAGAPTATAAVNTFNGNVPTLLAPSLPALRRDEPPQLPDLLRRSGFTAGLIGRLEGTENLADHSRKPLHHSLLDLGEALRTMALRRPARPLPARVAFLGTRGVGRTSSLCKLLSRQLTTEKPAGRVWQVEFAQPHPAEGLAACCRALGCKLEHIDASATASASAGPATATNGNTASPVASAHAANAGAASAGFLYADLPALSVSKPADNRPLRRFLDASAIPGRVLVLNAVYEQSALRAAYAAGRDLGATHLILTHLDELHHWGRLWDFLIEGDLTPLGLATGPAHNGDFEADAITAVLRRTLPGATQPPLS